VHLHWVNEYGGLLAAVISAVWAVASVFVAYHLHVDAKEKKDIVELIQRLAANMDGMRLSVDAFKESMAKDQRVLAVELKQVHERSEGSREDLKRLEGRIDYQQNTIHTFTEKIVTVTAQLQAVFRIIDAGKRASDT
jgi:hypothetical protein